MQGLGLAGEGACTGSASTLGRGRTELAGWASCGPEPIHLPVQLRLPWPAAPHRVQPITGASKGTWQPRGQEALAPFPAWPLKSSEVSRGRLASPGPSLHRAQNKQKQSTVHVRARGLGRGWHPGGVEHTRVLLAPSLHSPPPSRCSLRARSAVPRPPPHSAYPRPGRRTPTWGPHPRTFPSCSEGALAPTAHWARPLETLPLHLAVIGAHGRADRHRGQRMLGE